MNLDSIKKSLAKIPAWIKANPKKAGVVAVVVVVIAYFAIKRGASDTGETTAAPGLDSAGGGLSDSELIASGGGSIPGGTSSDSGGETTTTTTTTESGGGFSGESGGGFSESDFIPAIAPSGFVNAAPAFTGGAESILSNPTAALFRPASEMTGIKSPATSAGIAGKPAIVRPVVISKNNNTVRAAVNAPVVISKNNNTVRAAVRAPVVISKTDAEKAGLAKYYTGVSGGRRYVAGVFVGSVAAATLRRSEKV